MKFVDENNIKPEEAVEIIKDIEKEENRQDQLGIEETKQPEKAKPATINITKETWIEKTVATLVHLRKNPDIKSESLATIRGGEIVKVSSSFVSPSFEKVKYRNKDGYVKKEYVRDL